MDETKRLAKYIIDLQFADLKTEVVEKAKSLILDQLGCQLAFANLPWSKMVYAYVRNKKTTRKESTIAFHGLRTSAEDAAFANATFGHGFEMDDTEMRSASHPGVAVIPAALALAEKRKISGAEFIAAVVAGYDAMLRPAIAARAMMMRGFHSTGVAGPLGSAAAAGKLMKLSLEKMISALGIAASQSSGITEYAISGGSIKRLHAGFAAQSGLKAALLADLGITGPAAALEGKKGFCRTFSDECSIEEITQDLGVQFRIMSTGTKPYCCCAGQHAVIDAGTIIQTEHQIKSEEIAAIVIEQRPREAINVGNIIFPQDVISAQFSARFGLALRLIKGGNGFQDYSANNLQDPQLLDLIQKMSYVCDEDCEKLKVDVGPALVTIKLNDGSTFTQQVDYAKGTIQNPMTRGELEDKFRGLVSNILPSKHIEALIQAVGELDEAKSIGKLAGLLDQHKYFREDRAVSRPA